MTVLSLKQPDLADSELADIANQAINLVQLASYRAALGVKKCSRIPY